jgi:hypothetical protein
MIIATIIIAPSCSPTLVVMIAARVDANFCVDGLVVEQEAVEIRRNYRSLLRRHVTVIVITVDAEAEVIAATGRFNVSASLVLAR